MAVHWPSKAPGENVVDYDLDWSQRLSTGDSIATSTWSVIGTSLTLSGSAHGTTISKIFLSGGLINQTYILTNTITTTLGVGPLTETVTVSVLDNR